MNKLGMIDWGIGGIGVYRLIRDELGVPVTYLSDTGAVPYGKMDRAGLVARLNACVRFLEQRGITHLVIGCNAASTAIPYIDTRGITTEGMIDNAIEFTAALKPSRLGVIGGRRTILSGVYRRGFARLGITVEQRVAQPLSALIEAGEIGSPALDAAAKQILGPLRDRSHILLACTHYPAAAEQLASHVPPATVLVDPAASVVDKVRSWELGPGGTDVFVTTGDPLAMRRSARLAFGVEVHQVERVSL